MVINNINPDYMFYWEKFKDVGKKCFQDQNSIIMPTNLNILQVRKKIINLLSKKQSHPNFFETI